MQVQDYLEVIRAVMQVQDYLEVSRICVSTVSVSTLGTPRPVKMCFISTGTLCLAFFMCGIACVLADVRCVYFFLQSSLQ